VHGALACSNPFQLTKLNKARPRLLLLATSLSPIVHVPKEKDLLTVRVGETSSLTIVAPYFRLTRRIPASKVVQLKIPVRVRKATVVLHDRAGNTVTRTVAWG